MKSRKIHWSEFDVILAAQYVRSDPQASLAYNLLSAIGTHVCENPGCASVYPQELFSCYEVGASKYQVDLLTVAFEEHSSPGTQLSGVSTRSATAAPLRVSNPVVNKLNPAATLARFYPGQSLTVYSKGREVVLSWPISACKGVHPQLQLTTQI